MPNWLSAPITPDCCPPKAKQEEKALNVQRKCPVCNDNGFEVLYQQNFAESDFNLITNSCVVTCDLCGMGFLTPIPAQQEWDEYYMLFSKYAIAATTNSNDQSRFDRIADFFASANIADSSSVLDIGCSNGGLLETLAKRGFNKLTGVDPAPISPQFLREGSNVQYIQATINNFTSSLYYDVISLEQVLEHLVEPRTIIKKIAEMQMPGGLIYIGVPNGKNFTQSTDGPFQQFSVEHVNFFSLSVLKTLMHDFGYVLSSYQEIQQEVATHIEVPLLMTLWIKTGKKFTNEIIKDYDLRLELSDYIAQSSKLFEKVVTSLSEWVLRTPGLYLWGAGTHTLRLIGDTKLDVAHIKAIIDSNPFYCGRSIRGIPILSPSSVLNPMIPILISSFIAQKSIAIYSKEILGLENELLLLYPET